MQYDPRTMRRLAMNLVVDELDRPIAFEADNKVLYPFPTLAADSFGDYTELVGPNGEVIMQFVDVPGENSTTVEVES